MTKIIRTKTRAEGGITPEERARMDEHSKLWIDRAMRTEPIEPEKIIPAIEGLYKVAGLKTPRIVIVPSPLVMAFAYGASAAIWYARKNNKATTDAATSAATYAATYAATDDDKKSRAKGAKALAESAAARVCRELGGDLGISCAPRWYDSYQGGNMWAGYDCYLTACRDILGLELREHEGYAHWEQAAIHGGFRVMHEEFCLVSDFPEVLKVDDQNRPHCENGPSHRWRDGWCLYYWHGVQIPAEWIEDKESLTAKTALTWTNIEQRRAALEIVGWHNVLRELNAKVIDEHPDLDRKSRFIHARCGTNREFAIGVPPECQTVKSAQAWLTGLPVESFEFPTIRT